MSGFAHRMAMQRIASFDVDWRSTEEAQPLVWSANGKAIAYQDAQGFWLWNMLVDAQPQLVVPVEADQELLDLSHSGRYLRFGNLMSWTLLDVQTGDSWNNSLITPDESRLVHFVSERSQDFREQLERLGQCNLPAIACPMVLLQSPHTGIGSQDLPMDIFWHEPYQLGLAYPAGVESIPWSLSFRDTFNNESVALAELPSIRSFAYDAHYDQPAFAFDETKIGFGLREWIDYYDSVDLSEYLDSPIVDLEWGQPIFYEGR